MTYEVPHRSSQKAQFRQRDERPGELLPCTQLPRLHLCPERVQLDDVEWLEYAAAHQTFKNVLF